MRVNKLFLVSLTSFLIMLQLSMRSVSQVYIDYTPFAVPGDWATDSCVSEPYYYPCKTPPICIHLNWNGYSSYHVTDIELYIDGIFTSSHTVDLFAVGGDICSPVGLRFGEGMHTALIKGHYLDYATTPISRHTYELTQAFQIDNTAPTIIINHPTDNSVVFSTEAVLKGNISDNGSQIGIINMRFHYIDGACPRKIDKSFPKLCVLELYELFNCTSNIGITSNVNLEYNLLDYFELYPNTNCYLKLEINARDRVGNAFDNTKFINFIIDNASPEVKIVSPDIWSLNKMVSINGTAKDASDIKSLKLKIIQKDWKDRETFWNGSDWVTDSNTLVNITIPVGTNTINWSYAGLTDRNMISGSHYKLTVYAADKFDQTGKAETNFNYNACDYVTPEPYFDAPDKFEVGAMVFRKKQIDPFFKGHVGIYVVSDSNYQKGESDADFVNKLLANNGKLLPVLNSDFMHYIVHAEGVFGHVKGVSAETFIGGAPQEYWGPREPKDRKLTPVDRDEIAYRSAIQLTKEFELWGLWLKNPVTNEMEDFRCDGLIIYAHRMAGVPLVPVDETWTSIWPSKLLITKTNPLTLGKPDLKSISISRIDSQFKFSAKVEDKESGIDRIEYYLYDRYSLLGSTDTDSLSSQVYTQQCKCNPETNLTVRVVDRAGNWKVYDKNLTMLAESGALKDYPLPPIFVSPIPMNLIPLLLRKGYEKHLMEWEYISQTTPPEKLLVAYAIDKPFDIWNDENIVRLASGATNANFYPASGQHKFYLAAMDEWMAVGTAEMELKIPGGNLFVGSNIPITIGDVALIFDNITQANSFHANPISAQELPPGYNHLPNPITYDIFVDAEYQGGFQILVRYADSGVSPEQEPYLQILHNGQNITFGIDKINKIIAGYATSASPFTVAVSTQITPEISSPDIWSPFTEIKLEGPSYIDDKGTQYISTRTFIGLETHDDRMGVINTYYTLNMTESLFEKGLVPDSLGQFNFYTSSFTMLEGIHWTGYGSVDISGNYELLKTVTFYADGTPPETSFEIIGDSSLINGTVYITEESSVTFHAFDLPGKDNVASGFKETFYLVNFTTAQCAGHSIFHENLTEPPVFFGPPGTCDNPAYAGPFTLKPGTHTVYYFSLDNVGNAEEIKTVNIEVIGDTMPPVTTIAIDEPKFVTEVSTYVTGQTTFTLTVVDLPFVGASGFRFTEFRVDSGSWTLYENPWTLTKILGPAPMPEGIVSYWKFDEGSGTTAFDSAGTNHGTLINGPAWIPGKINSALNFDGVDDYVRIPASSNFIFGTGDFAIEVWAKPVVLAGDYRAMVVDVGSRWDLSFAISKQGTLEGYAGGGVVVSAPLSWNLGQFYHLIFKRNNGIVKMYRDGVEIYTGTLAGDIGSSASQGLQIGRFAQPSYHPWNGAIDEVAIYNRALTEEEINQRYLGIPTVQEGQHVILYRSGDNADNIEPVREQTVIVDETPPKTEFTLSGNYVLADPAMNGQAVASELQITTNTYIVDGSTMPYVPPGYQLVYSTNPGHYVLVPLATEKPSGKWLNFITSETELVLTATDTYSGLKERRYQIQDTGYQIYANPFTLSGPDGLYEIKYQSEDNLGHLEVLKSSEVYLDNTAPTSALQITNPKYQTGDTIYVSTLTQFTITSDDGNGCGFKEIKYAIDGQPFTLYASPFTLSEFSEGEHIVSYYSEDLLGNKEQVKTQKVILDKTPPQTILEVRGERIEESEGKIYVTSQTEITLLATDNLSGIKNRLWKLNSSGWFKYEASFRFSEIAGTAPVPEGCVSYWKFDEGSGTTAFDSAGTNHGTLVNGPVWIPGKINSALNFDGVDDHVRIPASSNFIFGTGDFAIEVWAKPVVLAGDYRAMVVDVGSRWDLSFAISKQGTLEGYAGGGVVVSAPLSWNLGQFYHLVFKRNNGIVKMYRDGVEIYTGTLAGDIGSSASQGLQIGRFAQPIYHPWNGILDEVAIYNRALTEEEINQRYAGEVLTEISDGEHLFSYYSIDNVDNKETVKTVVIVLDNTAPSSTTLSGIADELGNVILTWTSPGNDGNIGKAANYDLRISSVQIHENIFAQSEKITGVPFPQTAGSTETFTVPGLGGGTTWYFALKTLDEAGNVSETSNSPGIYLKYITKSTTTINGNPEILVSAEQPVEAALVSTTSETGIISLGKAQEQGLIIASNLYDISEGTYEPALTIMFYYSTTTLASLGIPEDEIAVYEYSESTWTRIPDQTPDPENNRIIAYISQIGSLFAIFRQTNVVTVNIEPDTLNLKSQGKYITAYLEVTAGNKTAADIEPSSIKIISVNDILLSTPVYVVQEQAGKSGKTKFGTTGDYDNDGIPDLMIKFDREEIIKVLPVSEQVQITLEGSFKHGEIFVTEDYIRTILPGNVSAKSGGSIIHPSKSEIHIPGSALNADAEFLILKIAKEPSKNEEEKDKSAHAKQIKRIGRPYEFGPEGIKFEKPVQITLPYRTEELNGAGENALKIGLWRPETKDWEILDSKTDIKNKTVTAHVLHFSVYQVLAIPVSEEKTLSPAETFQMGEVYVFPNPAKREEKPTFHIECGIAEKVKLIIYTTSGRIAHEHTITGIPQMINDGNGLDYAYEYAVQENLPSGIYYYYIECEKSGKKEKAKGKFAVVR